MKRQSGFTLIELLIVIAILLIVLAGEVEVLRLENRSALISHDIEMVSAALASELAQVHLRGIPEGPGLHPLPIPPEQLCGILEGATGTLTLAHTGQPGLVEVVATIAWNTPAGPLDMRMATLARSQGGETP